MSGFNRQSAIQKWARLALKCGLVLTDAKLWESIGGQLRDRVDDVSSEMKRRYADTTDRLERAQDAFQGRRNWAAPAASFLGGVGLGVGLGLLLAPASGQETRSALRDKVVNLKNRVDEMGPGSTPYRSAIRSSSTGTGDD
jgi:gas vesicle protein